jgi:hypothetical protein
MADAPDPITSPPAQSWQPYNASAPGAAEDQVTATTIYDAVAGDQAGGPWRKIQEAGACGPNGEATADSWPGNGASSDGGWRQV